MNLKEFKKYLRTNNLEVLTETDILEPEDFNPIKNPEVTLQLREKSRVTLLVLI